MGHVSQHTFESSIFLFKLLLSTGICLDNAICIGEQLLSLCVFDLKLVVLALVLLCPSLLPIKLILLLLEFSSQSVQILFSISQLSFLVVESNNDFIFLLLGDLLLAFHILEIPFELFYRPLLVMNRLVSDVEFLSGRLKLFQLLVEALLQVLFLLGYHS